MSLRDFALMVFVCLIWALNNIVAKLAIGTWEAPPLLFAATRFAIVAGVLVMLLRPMPRPRWRLVLAGLMMGCGSFTIYFLALKTSAPSSAAIVSQVNVPLTTLLSMMVLGERIHWRRGLGILLTFAGVMVVMLRPGALTISSGLLLVVLSAFLGSVGVVMMKQMPEVKPLRFQAWVSLVSCCATLPLSLIFERDQMAPALDHIWPLVAAVLFTSFVVSMLSHTLYYGLIQRYEANMVAPLTLMMPLATIALGVTMLGDPFSLRMAIGTALALTGVLIIAVRRNQVMDFLMALRGPTL